MKQNKYDDPIFFEKYSQMDRSAKGLQAAGEWETLRRLLPDFTGKRVLDLGCGYGWHCIYAAENGATEVVGIDISEKMLAIAREKTDFEQVHYACCAIEDFDGAAGSFDVVLSSLALHYIRDFDSVCASVNKLLKPGGHFVFSCEHPVFTAAGHQQWHTGDNGELLHWPVDRYFEEGQRTANFLGEDVTKYHRTMTSYINTLIQFGFALTGVVEPQPAANLLDSVPGMRDELRRPMMLIVASEKK